MGFLTGLLTLPLAPVRGVAWLGEQVLDLATQEEYDPAETYQRLAELDEAREAGEISAEECEAAEEALVAGLMRARAKTRGVRGGGPCLTGSVPEPRPRNVALGTTPNASGTGTARKRNVASG